MGSVCIPVVMILMMMRRRCLEDVEEGYLVDFVDDGDDDGERYTDEDIGVSEGLGKRSFAGSVLGFHQLDNHREAWISMSPCIHAGIKCE